MNEVLLNEWTINEWILLTLFITIGYTIKYSFSKLSSYDFGVLNLLYFYHLSMSMVYTWMVESSIGDAQKYWGVPKLLNNEQIIDIIMDDPTKGNFLYIINYIPSNLLDISFFSGNLLYGILGYFGLLLLYLTVKDLFPLNRYLNRIRILNFSIFPTLLFLPNFHFWSSGIGKDTIVFFSICAIIYAMLDIRKRWGFIVMGILLTYFVRPHILLLLFGSFAASYLLKSRLLAIQKAFILLAMVAIFIPFLNSVAEFANLEEASLDSFQEFSEVQSEKLSKRASSSIDVSSLPYPLKVLTFLYRPLFFDASGALGLISSIENLVWVVLTIYFILQKPIRIFKSSSFIILSCFIYWLTGALVFAPVFGNLGIIIRERNMILPAFILLTIGGLANSKKIKAMEWYFKNEKLRWDKKNLNLENNEINNFS